MTKRALISVYDKSGLEEFARGLVELGYELVASGDTTEVLSSSGLKVTSVEELTKSPEMLGGRVKTLHPSIHAAILARRDREDDVAALSENAIEPFDLVCVNFYPFAKVVARYGVREEDAVEMIDIGGPTIARAAAKNYAHVAVVSRTDQYSFVVDELTAVRRPLRRIAPAARRRSLRDHRRLRIGHRGLVRRPRGLPRDDDHDPRQGARSALR